LRRVGKRALEFLIKGRALDTFGTPPQLLEALDRIVTDSGNSHDAAAAGQMSLFGALAQSSPTASFKPTLLKPLDELESVPHKQILEWEKEALGVHVSEHPLERPLKQMAAHTNTTISDIQAHDNGRQVKLAGVLSALRTLTTKKGDPMAFGTLEDLDAKIDLVFFPRTWKAVRDKAEVDQVMIVIGKVQVKDEEPNIIVDTIKTTFESAEDADTANGRYPLSQPAPPPAPADEFFSPPPYDMAPPPPVKTKPAPKPAAKQPAPPPNFYEEENGMLNTPVVKESVQTAVAPPPTEQAKNNDPLLPTKQVATKQVATYETVVVEIRPVSTWKEVCRKSLAFAGQFQGQDRLRLRVGSNGPVIDFPNHHTQSCPELLEGLRMMQGVARVYKM
jgi:DNA polymerase-3 subunit alpha